MPAFTSHPKSGQFRWLMTMGLLLIALHGQAQACLCISESSSEQHFLDASLLFRGELISLRLLSEAERRRDHSRPLRGRYRLLESFKGPSDQAIIEVDSPADSCGFNDRIGAIRLMVAKGDASAGYTSDLCHFAPDPASMQLQQRKRTEMDLLLQQHPGDKQSHSARARYFLESHAFEQAITAYQALLRLWPSDTEALLALAQAQMGLHRYEAALPGFDTLLAMQAEQAHAMQGRQDALMRLNRHAELARPGLDLRGYRAGFREQGNFADANLQGAQFQNAQLNGFDFSRADLRESDFRGAKLDRANFIAARLDGAGFSVDTQLGAEARTTLVGADFSETLLQGADFSNVDLAGAKFRQAHLKDVKFSGSRLRGLDLQDARIENVDLSGHQLDSAKLRGAVFVNSSLRGASFSDPSPYMQGNFAPIDLRGTDLSGALLTDLIWVPALIDCRTVMPAGTDWTKLPLLPLWVNCPGRPPVTALSAGYPFKPTPHSKSIRGYESGQGVPLYGIDGRGSQMQDMNLEGYSISDGRFEGSNFNRAKLQQLRINRGSFDGADFRQAELQYARIWAVSLQGTDFRGANLREARLLELDLRQARLDGANLQGACYGAGTRWPAGFQPKKAGAKPCPTQ
ncbi:pentapeptide repeat-containing protein [Roseateles oligotrophus]|uniref:Pentapeptide repeat-containing protein n=1 Tax=Roseateles oligotrophus TaxID=1769250 RepID=A0ABT2YJL2_9BURK|nr:pentapeptide repeat-containing protein [Roseateles oligotrophus]MCV2370248.1 pentapeptide repeat-containing protein [Roseateles oligotrophus]